MYAQVVLGLPVDGPFDYSVPHQFRERIKLGMRVEVNFRYKKLIAYVVNLSSQTKIKAVKPIIRLLDEIPVLDNSMLLLTKELSEYYCSSWGEAVEAALPDRLRKIKSLSLPGIVDSCIQNTFDLKNQQLFEEEIELIHDLSNKARWGKYIDFIKNILKKEKSVIVIVPDVNLVDKTKQLISTEINCPVGVLYREQPDEVQEWVKIKSGDFKIVVGTRSVIFAPVNNLGLVIIDDEHSQVYKQEQVPHYHVREVAFMRARIEDSKVVLASAHPTLEVMHLVKSNKINYTFLDMEKDFPEVKTIEVRSIMPAKAKNVIFSKYLQDAIVMVLGLKGKVLLFLNRKGFSTFAQCNNCKETLKCPRCSINLVFHFKENKFTCHYCSFTMEPVQICPVCKAGYMKYSGFGTEKIESELSRIFPQSRIKLLNEDEATDFGLADIFVSSQAAIKHADCNFDLVGVLSIDNFLNRVDFRSTEKAFALLTGLLPLTDKKILIQTYLTENHCFISLEQKNLDFFYEKELAQRKQLGFPPYAHLGIIKLRGSVESKVKDTSQRLFDRLTTAQDKNIEIVSINPGQPEKLRGNFYWQILLKAKQSKKIAAFLKLQLKGFLHSGIIVTIDIDPV